MHYGRMSSEYGDIIKKIFQSRESRKCKEQFGLDGVRYKLK